MKANYKGKYFCTEKDIEKAVKAEADRRLDIIYEKVKQDVAAQIMAVCMLELNKEFGYGIIRMNRFYDGVKSTFKIMAQSGLLGKEFTPVNCIEYIKDRYDIDLDA